MQGLQAATVVAPFCVCPVLHFFKACLFKGVIPGHNQVLGRQACDFCDAQTEESITSSACPATWRLGCLSSRIRKPAGECEAARSSQSRRADLWTSLLVCTVCWFRVLFSLLTSSNLTIQIQKGVYS